MKTYVEKFIAEESRTELDLQFPYYSDTEKDENGDTVSNEVLYAPELRNSYVNIDVSMDIDEVVNILNSLKQKGAERVYIAEHLDHHGYYFYGVKLEDETPEGYKLRMAVEAQRLAREKEYRHNQYLQLKKEFEGQ